MHLVGGGLQLGRIVEVPILFRCDEGQVRLCEANGQEKRCLHLAQGGHRKVSHFAILKGVVRHVRRFRYRPLRTLAILGSGLGQLPGPRIGQRIVDGFRRLPRY